MKPEIEIVIDLTKYPKGSEYLAHFDGVAAKDCEGLRAAEKSYGNSWKKRGGVSAFFMLSRKWDRLEKALGPGRGASQGSANIAVGTTVACAPYDIFRAIEIDPRAEGIIDDIRDLRRYLMLVESEMIARGVIDGSNHRDNQS